MKRTYVKVEIQKDGTLKSVIHKDNCGATLLQLNGAGCKAALLHNINHHAKGIEQSNISGADLKGHPIRNINFKNNNINNLINNSNLNNITSEMTFQDHSKYNLPKDQQAGASLTEAQIDDAFIHLHLNDTHYIPMVIYQNNHQFKEYGLFSFTNRDERTLNGHLEIMYKAMLVQAFNFHVAYKHCIDPDCAEMIVTSEDIEKSLRYWAPKLGYPKKEVDRAVTSFMYKITDEKISKDYEIAKCSSWTLRKWYDGDNFTQRLRIYPDVQLLTIYEYGHKDSSFNNIVTYDGDMCLKMPFSLRAELQAWYEQNPRQCRKELTEMLSDKFCNGTVDVYGEEHNFNSFFRSLKNRTVKPAEDFTNVKKNMQQLLDLYPSQNDAKSWITTPKDIL